MSYIDERLRPRANWYDRRAVFCKRVHLTLEITITLLSVMMLFVVHVESVSRLALAAVAALIAGLLGVGRTLNFGERWLLYRQSAETLQMEEQLFLNGAGPYFESDNPEQLLVERTERTLYGEALRWTRLTQGTPSAGLKGTLGG